MRGENDVGVLGQASQVGVVTESLLETTTSLTATATLAAKVRTRRRLQNTKLTLIARERGKGHQESAQEGAPQNSELWWYKKEPTEVQSLGRQVDIR